MKILIADDDLVTSRLLEKIIKKMGYESVVTHSAQEALDILLSEDSPKIALVDWMMPEIDGLEICRKVREDTSAYYKYIILVTSKDLQEDIIKGMNAGADDYITKPFSYEELTVRINAGRRIIELQDQLTYIATYDVLTGVLNRRAFLKRLNQEISRCKRIGSPLGLVLADLDQFKSLNDTYGHVAGDKVLAETAHLMRSCLREYDEIGRYGGEEFFVILPGANLDQAENVANRMRKSIENFFVNYEDKVLQVTISFGVYAIEEFRETCDIYEYFKIADKALYEAKRKGRNCVVRADNVNLSNSTAV
jgi:two-component system chemotaxis response regulator CheY